jgi:hypothetical protein
MFAGIAAESRSHMLTKVTAKFAGIAAESRSHMLRRSRPSSPASRLKAAPTCCEGHGQVRRHHG